MTKEQFKERFPDYELFRVYEMFEIYVSRDEGVFHVFKVSIEETKKGQTINYTSEYRTTSLKEAEKYITAYWSVT